MLSSSSWPSGPNGRSKPARTHAPHVVALSSPAERFPVKSIYIVGALGLSIALAGCNGITPTAPSAPSAPRITTPTQVVVNASPGELPIGGGTATIGIAVSAADGQGVDNITVAITASTGSLERSSVITDRTGHASVTWSGTETATITGTAGELVGIGSIPVNVAYVPPPPSTPRPPPPAPKPDPPTPDPPPIPVPPPTPAVVVTLSADHQTVGQTHPVIFAAAVSLIGDTGAILSYTWDWDDAAARDETSADPTRTHTYASEGVRTVKVTVTTANGQTGSATLTIAVVN